MDLQILELNNDIIAEKKHITYDDILASLNMIVVDGILQIVSNSNNTTNYYFNQIQLPVLSGEKQRIRESKSTKMRFSTLNNSHGINI